MASTFAGLSIATRGLYSSQGGLMVTTNNISNVNTEGYSRKVVQQSAVATTNSDNRINYNGAGSQITAVNRVREMALNQKYWRENQTLGQWETKAATLTEMESFFGEAPSNDLNDLLEEFYTAMEDLAADPGSGSARTVMRQAGNTVCEYLGSVSNQLTGLREELNNNVMTVTNEINRYAQQIAAFNQQIHEASVAGVSTNDLEDQRDLAIDNLSKLVGIEVCETVTGKNTDGTVIKSLAILINGNSLVSDTKARTLECYTINDGGAQNGMYGIRWQDSGAPFNSTDGELNAYLDLRDGNGAAGTANGVPYYLNQLDEFARTFAKAINEGIYNDGVNYYPGHSGGYGADGSTGIRFFSYNEKSSADLMASGADMNTVYANITAANITLSADVLGDVNKIAVASAAGETDNNENLNDLIKICKDTRLFNQGSTADFISAIISTLGSDSAYAQKIFNNSNNLVKNIGDRRTSQSGVSIDEEAANLTKYQQIYDASAKMVNVWNQIYQETIDLIS